MSRTPMQEEKRNKFIQDYHHYIEDRVKQLDNHQHTNTSNKRHLNRLRNKIIDDLMEEASQIGYVSKIDRGTYRKNLVQLDEQPKTHFWKHKLAAYDAEDAKLGTTKESRLKETEIVTFGPIVSTKRKIEQTCVTRKKLKSVVTIPTQKTSPTTPENSSKEMEKAVPQSSENWLKKFLESTMHSRGYPDYKVPNTETKTLPPRYSVSNPHATTLFIRTEKLDAITAQKISAQEKRNLIIKAQDRAPALSDNYDFHDFDLNKLDENDYGDLGLDY
jgi:hypothetical protein